MARLPQPGGDKGNWGAVLNTFLQQVHNNDGSLKSNSVGSAQLQTDAVDADIIKDSTITNAQVASNAAISQGKIASLTDDLAAKANITDVAAKLDADGGMLVSDLDADSNKITNLAEGDDDSDGVNVGQLASAISDVETDVTSVGTEIIDLPTALRADAAWVTTYTENQNFFPIIQNGVAKKMPVELMATMLASKVASVSGTTHTWTPGERIVVCTNTSPLTLTLPGFGSAPGMHIPVTVIRFGTGTVTIAGGSNTVVLKKASQPLTLAATYSVAEFMPITYINPNTVYLVWGDLG